MAAFEAISQLRIKPISEEHTSEIDVRSAILPSNPPSDDEFDPRDHRNPKTPITPTMASFNIVRSLFGAGMLGMPLAVSQAGMVIGPLMLLFTGCLMIHMHFTLLNCLNEIARQLHIPYISYRYGFRLALLRGPPFFIAWATVIMDWQSSEPAILILFLPYLILEFAMKSLKIVSYVSLFGNLLNVVGLSLVFYQIFKDPHGEVVQVVAGILPLVFSFGTCMFNLCAVGVILSMEKAMKDPKVLTKYCGVLTIALGIPTVVSVIFGALGYWSFGTMEENILRSLPFDETISFVAIGLYMVAVALAFPIQCYPAIQMILEVVKNHDARTTPSEKTLTIVEWVSRPLFVLSAFFVCYMIPFQAPFVAFVGNLCTTALALIFPAIMELGLKYPNRYGKYNIYLIKDVIVVVIGMVSWLLGAVLSGYLIYVRVLTSYPQGGDGV